MTSYFGRAVAFTGTTILLTACSLVAGEGSIDLSAGIPGVEGIGYDEAVAIARDHVGRDAEFIRAEATTLGAFDMADEVLMGDEPRDRLVWAIFFRVTVVPYCPVIPLSSGEGHGPHEGCLPYDGEARVVLDYRTGEFLYSHEGPSS